MYFPLFVLGVISVKIVHAKGAKSPIKKAETYFIIILKIIIITDLNKTN